jgi:hypothetical protein
MNLQERTRTQHRSQASPPLTVREDQWQILTSGLFTHVLELSIAVLRHFRLKAVTFYG